MIQKLYIRNFAIIDALEIAFSDRLTIITGETGAGKSILLGALGLIMGNRADNVSLYNPTEKCVIEGTFDIGNYDLREYFENNDLDYDREISVRREISPNGKSRAFINDTPVSLKVLQQLSGALIDLHLQFDTLDIHEVGFQLRMIDALADNKALLTGYQQQYRAFQAGQRRLAALTAQNDNAAREIEFLQFQLEEFNKAELVAGEQDNLEAELTRLNNAEIIKRTMGAAYRHLSDSETAVVGQLEDLNRSLGSVRKFHKGIESLYNRLDSLIAELQDVASEAETIADDTEYDGQRIAEIQERLNTIYKLQKKHHVATVEELLAIQDNLQQQLQSFGDLGSEIEQLESDLRRQEGVLRELALDLRQRRQSVVAGFQDKVHLLLGQMAMEHARLQVSVNPLDVLTPTGMDDVQFLFAPNKGSRFQPIREVASGGELSRLTLVTKSLVASAIPLPTLIFDEIDTGISGDVAQKMGKLLQDLASHHQVVSITHSPQIASKAHRHYFVYKKELEHSTVTNVKLLEPEERVIVIAEMLSSKPPTASAIENARELLGAN